MKNGHQFAHSKPRQPDEVWSATGGGDWGCVLCGAWTTYCLSAAQADEKLGPCPKRRELPAPERKP